MDVNVVGPSGALIVLPDSAIQWMAAIYEAEIGLNSDELHPEPDGRPAPA
jgi:hypothetical protein